MRSRKKKEQSSMLRVVKIALCTGIFIVASILSGCGTSVIAQKVHANAHTGVSSAPAHPRVTATPAQLLKPQTNMQANPVRLVIPSIGVSASVETVGILNNGDLATPTHNPWEDVGWFVSGPRPGGAGSAVMDGHLDRPGGYPAVFWNLRNIQIGATVMVITANGKTLSFRVTRVALYQPQAAPIQEIFGNASGAYLNLITCAGDWIPSQHQTSLRLVVYTTLI
jgi:sortase (surface protein transpeptidase)